MTTRGKTRSAIVLLGLSHQTASVALREQLHLGLTASDSLPDLVQGCGLGELVLVSTCNRLEVYATLADGTRQVEPGILQRMSEAAGLAPAELAQSTYRMRDADAVRHLLRVACGLDSQMLGEAEVLGQISQALTAARSAGTIGPTLSHVFMQAVHVGRRARTETGIGHGPTSISHAAAALVERELRRRPERRVLVLGAGEAAELAVHALRKRGVGDIVCVSRSLSRATAMARLTDCVVLPWAALAEALAGVDAVITATSAPHPILYADDVERALGERGNRSVIIVDIAVPRDVDPQVGDLPTVTLLDIDQLERSLDERRACREAAAVEVERIVAEETPSILQWIGSRQAVPVVRTLRERATAIADDEALKAIRKLDIRRERERDILLHMARRVVNKVLHVPTTNLMSLAGGDRDERYLNMAIDLFGLDPESLSSPGMSGSTQAQGEARGGSMEDSWVR